MATPTSTWGMDDILSLALEKTGVEASPLPPPPPPLMLNGNRSVSYPGTVDDLFSSVSAPTTPHNLYTPSPGYQNTSALPAGDYMPSPGWVPNTGDHPAVTTNNGGMFPQATTSNGGAASIEEELAALLESTDADYLPTLPVPDQQSIDTNFLPFPSTSTAPPLPTHRSQMMGDFDVLSLLGLDANGAPPPPSFSQTSGYMSPMRSTGSPSNARSVVSNRYQH